MALFTPQAIGRLSLARIAGFMGLLGITLIVLVSTYIGWSEYDRRRAAAQDQIRSTAFFLADHASRLMEVSDIALRGAAARIGGRSWDALEASQELQIQLKALTESMPYVDDLWLNDEAGRLRLTTFAFPPPPSNSADREVFRSLRQSTDQIAVSERIVGRVTHKSTFLIARRLSGQSGNFRGMASVTAQLDYFNDYWEKVQLPLDARVRLIRAGSFDVVAQHPRIPENGGPIAYDAGLFRATIEAEPEAGVFVAPGVGPGEDERLVAYRRVSDLPLYLTVGVSQPAIVAQWRGWLLTYLPFASAALLGLGALSYLAFRQSRREAIAFEALRKAQRELSEANTSLETRVSERTAELQEANEETQRFAYIVSHDLRAPLVNIMGFTSELETLRADLVATDRDPARTEELGRDFDEALGFIKAAISKMDGLIGAILKISREGRRTFRPEKLDMSALVQGLADAQRHQMDQGDISIEVRSLPGVTSDRLALEQIFGNLLDNAVKYMQPGRPGHIEVKGRRHGTRYVIYEVADNGRGIAPEDRTRVFELFRRAGAQDKPGEGIGLAHVRTLVRSLGGRIDLTSQAGVGTTFMITLPVEGGVTSQRSA